MDRAEIFEQLKLLVVKNFRADPDTISENTSADDVDGWDSLAHATLIMRIEKTFNIHLDPLAASEAHNLGALAEVISESANRT
ncbi:acyl carrier protein [Sphingobium yanoikuyae]|uniref:acyl carrier protein n=1 Tax=Sphingobium yanoikuyae TaxID=13690 RepID=UPI0028B21338|nr:acyl carrier protein [Sphingobium yanoikuyae]